MNPTARYSNNILTRLVLAAFVVTFAICRIMVLNIMNHRTPNLYLHVGGVHVHHLHYGIWILCGTNGFLLFKRAAPNVQALVAILYGVALGLIFDEYAIWMNLGGPYWQSSSFAAVVVIAGLLTLMVMAPAFRSFRPRHWVAAAVGLVLLTSFGKLIARPVHRVEQKCMARLIQIEAKSPR